MCGIFGYVGASTQIAPMVAAALRTMEYRGYDSWGIGWDDGTSLACLKGEGRVPAEMPHAPRSGLALGHTRWATHGVVCAENAHPHVDCTGRIGVVHNGVIENVVALRSGLDAGHAHRSQTDSEVVAHLVETEVARGASLAAGVAEVFRRLDGTNAIVVCDRETGEIAAVTSRSPLRLGRADGAWYLASDPLALTGLTEEVAVIPDHALLSLSRSGAALSDLASGDLLPLEWSGIPKEDTVALGEFVHFTDKEIHEQPGVIRRLIDRAEDVRPLVELIRASRHIVLTGCGSAHYAATVGVEWLKTCTDAWIDVLPASELDAHARNLGEQTLLIALTQSGETADVVDAIHVARGWGARTVALVNTMTSTVTRMVDVVVPLLAGTERSVLATKSFMAMLTRTLQVSGMLREPTGSGQYDLARAVPVLEAMLDCEAIHDVAARIGTADHVLTLGKGIGHKVALEAALKVKEGSYVHAEAFLTGELKHGPLALVAPGMPCVLFSTSPVETTAARIASHEIMSRGGYTVGIGGFAESDCSLVVSVPDLGMATALIEVGFAQRIAYEVARHRGVDPDYPRNLAKSVTVR
jgi:glucosamine--fructose-6-phosphate aminotransferase (isomerizing)